MAKAQVPEPILAVSASPAADLDATARGVHAAALAALPRASSARLHKLLKQQDPAEVWSQVVAGELPRWASSEDFATLWHRYALDSDLNALAKKLESLDAWVTTPVSPEHPPALVDDIDPAPILFRRGRVPDSGSSAPAGGRIEPFFCMGSESVRRAFGGRPNHRTPPLPVRSSRLSGFTLQMSETGQ